MLQAGKATPQAAIAVSGRSLRLDGADFGTITHARARNFP